MLERLNKTISEKEESIDELENQIQEIKSEADLSWDWARHTKPEEDSRMPVPRLELRAEVLNEFSYAETYQLIYRHFLGHLVAIPLGQTKVSGGHFSVPNLDRLPGRDGAHIKSDKVNLNLPAFHIVGDEIKDIDLIER